ncbi:Potassium/sodium hyperpolarization-activated cyclic nucleotide-gated channel 4 [Temnothorax longispinosus]|uniref:Potassium/sodium hyperpolarization-activated cyclic nucleotide-gated channel 4 n=1 Tax=Temnothorax longispinosus TaxID=300112 RepID=A0A4S2JBG9_9HYME|nr:Potassium/sodium hyperpolarization-activated cyclic nucleotide-gated channel 4 [Temnothorax longispinosus]
MDLMALVPDFTTAPRIQREPRVEHVCEMPPKEDLLLKIIPESSPWSRLRRWFLSTRIASRKHPLTLYCLKSTQAIDYEISRHLKSHPYMIHPFSSFRICWESVMTLFIVAALLATPVFLAFYFDEYEKWYIFNLAIDAVFMCDIVIWFFTGYYDSNTHLIVLDPRIVASKYLRGFFVVDMLSVLPLEFLIVLFESMWYLASLNLLKILWIRTVITYSRRLYYVRIQLNPLSFQKLLLHKYRRLMNTVELFGYLPQTVVTQLIGAVRSEIFMPNDALVKASTRGDALYFVASGTVAVYNNVGKEICHLEDGAYFGELALLMEDERWIASVVAAENCEVYVLSRGDFQYALTPYPDLLAHLQKVALARPEQTPLLEKAHELDSPTIMSGNVNISSIKVKRRD